MAENVYDWWEDLFLEMLRVAEFNVHQMEKYSDGSPEALCLLMEAAEQYQFIRQAYLNRCRGGQHAGVLV